MKWKKSFSNNFIVSSFIEQNFSTNHSLLQIKVLIAVILCSISNLQLLHKVKALYILLTVNIMLILAGPKLLKVIPKIDAEIDASLDFYRFSKVPMYTNLC